MRAFGDRSVAGVPGGQGIESWLACLEFKPSATKDSPCRAAMHPDGHGYELVSSVRALVPQKFSVEEELMHVKHVEVKSPNVGVMWKFGRGVISSDRAQLVEVFLESEGFCRMDRLARSPDLSPIKHAWDFLRSTTVTPNSLPRDIQGLKTELLNDRD
ncbi:hypothetical protein TNCV_2478391 [Trichonephila clavipes]|nr:hypothetical protein TNCV_2478391 [Trichonephila clavipes]